MHKSGDGQNHVSRLGLGHNLHSRGSGEFDECHSSAPVPDRVMAITEDHVGVWTSRRSLCQRLALAIFGRPSLRTAYALQIASVLQAVPRRPRQ